ncbi:exported hypothetical protein [Mesorhizobium ventifaucium]|uniref:Uncharacterized protein n=1 Tax=Mesorhizobium ventifaucium TaxID=666020 RepID=A0ABM9DGR7_9HYPH|nr:exported hypothetical protein [Mesorhizobium ventifaucium]
MNMWPARVLLLALLVAWPAHSHDAAHDERLLMIAPAPNRILVDRRPSDRVWGRQPAGAERGQ